MANPNIAALTELYGGTLAWEIEPKQPVYAYGSSIAVTPTSWSGLDGSGNLDINTNFTLGDALDNRIVVATFSSANYWGSEVSQLLQSGYPSIYNPATSSYVVASGAFGQGVGDAIGTSNAMRSSNNAQNAFKMFYWKDAPLTTGGSAAKLRWTTGSATGNQGTKLFHYQMATFYNVNQTNPFKFQLKGTWGADSLTSEQFWNYSSDSDGINDDQLVTAAPGDLAYIYWNRHSYVNPSSEWPKSISPSGESDPAYLMQNNSYTAYSKTYYKSVNTSQGEFGLEYKNSYASTSTYSDSYAHVIVMQPADASTLFTVPTGYIVKVNQIYASAAQAGLAFQAQVNGLAANGATPNTIHDTSGADIITTNSTTPNGAIGTIASGVAILPGVQTKALTQPIWLHEGNGLAASVSFAEPNMANSTTMKPAPSAFITVSLEVIKT